MINSILYCLLGHTGGIFIEKENGFVLNENIETITNSEKEFLLQVCKLGYKYKFLNTISNYYEKIFNNELLNSNPLNKDLESQENKRNNQKNDSTSIYLNGVYRTIKHFLAAYRNIIEQLESQYYKEGNITLYDILSALSSFNTKMECLENFINYIHQNNLSGGEFLNYLYQKSINGNPLIRDLYKILFQNCNMILNNMITTWIINNIIQNSEFFIGSNNNALSLDSDNIDNIYNYFNNDLQSWNATYYIIKENIPMYYPQELVDNILFIGKAIKILNSNKNNDECKISFNDMSIFYTSLQGLNEIIFKKNDNILNMIDIEFFCKIITLIKNCVSKYLWKLIVNKNELIKHINAV